MKKEFSNGEITIVWEPSKCQHSGICVKTLPEVYKPKEKPWIIKDDDGVDAHSLLAPPVAVSLVKQLAKIFIG